MAPHHILIVIISSVVPENLVLLTKSEQSGPKSAHIRPTMTPSTSSAITSSQQIENNQDVRIQAPQVFHFHGCNVSIVNNNFMR